MRLFRTNKAALGATLAASLVLTLTGAVLSAPAHGADTLDQSSTFRNTDFTFGCTGTSVSRGTGGAQIFTAGLSGSLTKVDLGLYKKADVTNLSVAIHATSGTVPNAVPNGTALASQMVDITTVPSTAGDEFTVEFASPTWVTAGTPYALVASTTDEYDNFKSPPTGGEYFWCEANPYADGNGAFGSWTAGGSGLDFTFATYVDTSTDSDPTASVPSPTYVDFQFLLPDGRECTAISPARVRVGSMYQLPGVDAACRTVPGASVAGWTIPVPPGFTGYGSSAMAFPPGLSVRVVESQRFTVVPREPTLRADLDANIAEADSCVQTKTLNTSNRGRVEHVWVPREDIALARFPTSSSCVPAGHVLIGWNTAGDGSGETFAPGAPMPEGWAEDHSNTRQLYAMWVAG